MKINKLVVRGEKQTSLSASEAADTLTLKEIYVMGVSTRGGDADKHEVNLDENHLVEFVFDDDSVWLSSGETIADLFPETAAVKKRGGDTAFEVPLFMQSGAENRGLVSNIGVKLLKVFSKKAVKKNVSALAADLEKKQLDNKSGLFRLDAGFQFLKDIPANSNKPYLLFLHGTASSSSGSFGELVGSELWKYIHQFYEQRVLAFQHETLTKSPLKNVLELVAQLPDKAVLHIIRDRKSVV